MKQFLKVLGLVTVLIACSDFFPEKVVERRSPGGGSQKPLPEKATLDEKACDYGEATGDLRIQFLWNLATKSVCPRVREFRYQMTLLRLSANQICIDQESTRAEKDLNHHWYGAISAFEYLVANPMEPMRANSNRIGMEIYSWPNANKYSLNGELVKAGEQGDAYTMNLTPTRKGLTAVERLIFNKEALLTPGLSGRLRAEEQAFNDLPREKRRRARCVVLSRMLEDTAQHTEELYGEWDASQKQYPRRMLERLAGGAGPMILNEVSDGLFYLEKVKDFKLGFPLGQNARCRKDRCPEEIEHLISGAGAEALRENFEALRAGLVGQHGPGFLNLVREVGRADLADSMQAMITGMDETLKQVEASGDLQAQVLAMDKAQCADVTSPVPLCRLYFQIKAFSTVYRSDFMTALNLNPPRTEADND